jgi:hypothetical protein|nr:MAG TPA: hypothetical protein [Caudoviricetes sp.]
MQRYAEIIEQGRGRRGTITYRLKILAEDKSHFLLEDEEGPVWFLKEQVNNIIIKDDETDRK